MLKWVAAICCILAIALSATTGWALYSRFSGTNRARAANAHVWHVVICDIEQQTFADKKITSEQKSLSIQFFDGLLVNDIHTDPCGLQGGTS